MARSKAFVAPPGIAALVYLTAAVVTWTEKSIGSPFTGQSGNLAAC